MAKEKRSKIGWLSWLKAFGNYYFVIMNYIFGHTTLLYTQITLGDNAQFARELSGGTGNRKFIFRHLIRE